VICHLCGRANRDLAGSHLPHAHGLDADAYRVLVGLSPRRALQAPALSARRSALLRQRLASDPRIGAGMAVGAGLARSGRLQRRAEQTRRERAPALERERQLAADGARLGTARAETFRERRAQALGYEDLEAFYRRRRYLEQRIRIERLAGELGCAVSAARGDLARLELGPDRSRSAGARWRAGG
jgi:hypothetical protein